MNKLFESFKGFVFWVLLLIALTIIYIIIYFPVNELYNWKVEDYIANYMINFNNFSLVTMAWIFFGFFIVAYFFDKIIRKLVKPLIIFAYNKINGLDEIIKTWQDKFIKQD